MRKIYLLLTSALLLLGSSTMWADCTQANAIASQRVFDYSTFDMVTYYYCSTEDALDAISESLATSNCEVTFYQGAQITIPALVTKTTKKLTVNSATNSSQDSILIVNDFYGELTIKNFNQAARIDNNKKITVTSQDKSNLFVKNSATGTVNLNNAAAYNDTRIINNEGVINITSGIYNTGVSITNNGGTINISGETVNCRFSENVSFINNEGTISITGGYFAIPLYDQIRGFIAEGYAAYRTTNQYGEWYAIRSLGNNVATVNGIPYENLLTALEYSSEEYPATLITNVSVDFSDYLLHTRYDYLDMNGFNIQATGTIELLEASLTIKNSIPSEGGVISTSSANQGSLIALVGAAWDKEESSVLSIGEGVTIKNTSNANYGVSIFGTGDDHNAYGVKVNIAGKVLTENGTALCINGMVQTTDGHVPQINIADGAVLGNAGEGCSQACIYAAGYGIWNIGAATLKANTPIYAKAGIINIDGADIEACGEFSEPTAYSGGFYPTGDAIILDTHKSYAGNMLLNIMGDDTQIKAAHGYAIHEAMTKAASTDASSAIGLTIQGIALIEGGDEVGAGNATKFTDRFTQALKDGSDSQYQWVLNGVSGGRYTSEPSVVAPGYEAEFNTTTGYWEVHPQSTPVPSKLYTIIEDTEWPATDLADNSEVLIKTGATLTVPSISVESGSTITVEPGAKLIAGENGITTADASGLILKADKDNGTGIVLFDGTTSNKQPMGTVELYLVAKKIDDSNYVWQHFGIPTTSAPTITRIEPVSYKDWDVKQGWIYTSGSAALTAPWVGHNVTTSAIAEGNIISFAGTLVGMTDATLNLSKQGYNCLSNSFTAPISVKSFVSGIGTSLTTDGMVWIYDPETDNFTKKNKASFILDPTDVFMPSMQGFFLLNSGASPIEVSLPYSNVETTAGLKDAAAYNGGIISLSNGVATSTLQILEGDEFSDEFENSFDGYQMPTGNIQIYAIQGTDKLASIATNKIDGKEIEIVTTAGTEYSLSFSNLLGNAFKLKDLLTGDEIEVSEDNVYRFTAEPNSTLRRFKISEGEVSADEADADAVKVWVAESSLNIAGAVEGDAIEIINLAGVKVLSATATGEAVQAISLNGIASGAYIVKAGAATVKVIK